MKHNMIPAEKLHFKLSLRMFEQVKQKRHTDIVMLTHQNHNYITRHCNNLILIKAKTNIINDKKNIKLEGPKIWNFFGKY